MVAHRSALRAAKDAVHAVDPTMLVVGNALTPCDNVDVILTRRFFPISRAFSSSYHPTLHAPCDVLH